MVLVFSSGSLLGSKALLFVGEAPYSFAAFLAFPIQKMCMSV
jgi:hypothetical protein